MPATTKLNNFKGVSKDKYTEQDLEAIESFEPQEKKFGREIVTVSVSLEIKTWLNEVTRYLNRQSKRKITRSEVAFLALTKLKKLSHEEILQEIRNF